MLKLTQFRLSIRYLGLLLVAVAVVIFSQPSTALATTSEVGVSLPAAQEVRATRAELVAKGCVDPANVNAKSGLSGWSTFVTYPDGFVYLVPSDGYKEFDVTIPVLQKGFFNNPNKIDLGIFCPYGAVKNLITANKVPQPLSANQKIIVNILNTFLELIANLGLWLLEIASGFVSFFIPLSSFITNPYVTGGWPFVQGIANLGFLLALLFIAGATTLRIQSFAAAKMLPRLLAAALLINFSLVLAGIFIDLSRVLMAIMVNLMGGGINLNNIGMALIKQSAIFQGMLNATGTSIVASGNGSWFIPLKIAEGAVLIYALAIGMALVAVGLIVRYIILIILLIFSPFAYLAFAFPNMDKFAKMWWTQFLTWVFYGPILLFILLLIATLPRGIVPNAAAGDPLGAILGIGITSALLIAGYKFGKSFAGAAGAAAIGFAVGNTKRAVKYAYNNPKKTAAMIPGVGLPLAGAMYVGQKGYELGKTAVKREAAYAGRRVLNATGLGSVGDFFVDRRKTIDKQRKKAEDARRRTSFGTRASQSIYDPDQYKLIQEAQAAGNKVSAPGLAAQRLRNSGVQDVVNKDQIKAIVTQGIKTPDDKTDAQIQVLVNSPTLAGKMDEETVQNLTDGINERIQKTANQDEKRKLAGWIGSLNQSLQKAADSSKKPPEEPKKP